MLKMKIRMKNKHKTLPENISLTTYALVNFLESRYKARLTDIWYAQTPHVDIDEIGSADIKNPSVEFPPTLPPLPPYIVCQNLPVHTPC